MSSNWKLFESKLKNYFTYELTYNIGLLLKKNVWILSQAEC
jgi:hypothetical protein